MCRTAMSGTTTDKEIEVTPEMIEAGVREFCSYDSDLERPKDIVADIFRAMVRASRGLTEAGDLRANPDREGLVQFARKMQQEDSHGAAV